MKNKYIVIFIFFIWFAVYAQDVKLKMHDGQEIHGSLLELDESYIVIDPEGILSQQSFPLAEIDSVFSLEEQEVLFPFSSEKPKYKKRKKNTELGEFVFNTDFWSLGLSWAQRREKVIESMSSTEYIEDDFYDITGELILASGNVVNFSGKHIFPAETFLVGLGMEFGFSKYSLSIAGSADNITERIDDFLSLNYFIIDGTLDFMFPVLQGNHGILFISPYTGIGLRFSNYQDDDYGDYYYYDDYDDSLLSNSDSKFAFLYGLRLDYLLSSNLILSGGVGFVNSSIVDIVDVNSFTTMQTRFGINFLF